MNRGRLYDRRSSFPTPCEPEFATVERHFIRHIRTGAKEDLGLSPHQIISDYDAWGVGENIVVSDLSRMLQTAAAEVDQQTGRLCVVVPEQWERLQAPLDSGHLESVLMSLMNRIEGEQAEYRVAMSLYDDLVARNDADEEFKAVLAEYLVSQRGCISELRRARQNGVHVRRQAEALFSLLRPRRHYPEGE